MTNMLKKREGRMEKISEEMRNFPRELKST